MGFVRDGDSGPDARPIHSLVFVEEGAESAGDGVGAGAAAGAGAGQPPSPTQVTVQPAIGATADGTPLYLSYSIGDDSNIAAGNAAATAASKVASDAAAKWSLDKIAVKDVFDVKLHDGRWVVGTAKRVRLLFKRLSISPYLSSCTT